MCNASMYASVLHVSLGCRRLTVLYGVLLWNYLPSTGSLFSACTCAKTCCASRFTFGLYSSLVLVVRVCLEFCSVL